MTIDEVRKQIGTTTQWPIYLRVDGQVVKVERREDTMIPPAGNLICVYQEGAFHVLDCDKISVISRWQVETN